MTNIDSQMTNPPRKIVGRATLRGHLEIARIDHWFKNVFIIPGAVAAVAMDPQHIATDIPKRAALGLASVCLVASSNYVINEVLDAPSDLAHPTKFTRPVPSGRVNVPLAYVQWLLLMVVGVGLGYLVSVPFAVTVFVLWVMGCIYNIRPVRSKDLPYVDVLSEAVNNPLRMLAGWFIVGTASVAPGSLLLSYWMVGCYFMAMKRYAEYREIADPGRAAAYRKSSAGDTFSGLGDRIPRDQRRVVDSLAAHPGCRACRVTPAVGNTLPGSVLSHFVGAGGFRCSPAGPIAARGHVRPFDAATSRSHYCARTVSRPPQG